MDVDKILFRASSIGKIMTDSKNTITEKQLVTIDELSAKMRRTEKQEEELRRLLQKRDNPDTMSETAKTYLKQVFLEHSTGRQKMVYSKYLEKGIKMEEDAISLLNLVEGPPLFRKNKERIYNKFLQGEPDLYRGKSIRQVDVGYDTKVAYDIFTMPSKKDTIDPMYKYQDLGYCALTGAPRWITAHCLLNGDPNTIVWEKKKHYDLMGGHPSVDDSPEYKEICRQIERNYIFDLKKFKEDYPYFEFHTELPEDLDEWEYNIPREKRVVKFVVERDASEIERIYEKVVECRKWIKDNLL